jgi:hypothetical protein
MCWSHIGLFLLVWPTLFKDTHEFCRSSDSCLETGGLKTKKWQVGNNTSRGTFYEVGSKIYKSN